MPRFKIPRPGKTRTFYAQDALFDQLQAAADRDGVSVSSVINDAILREIRRRNRRK